MKIRNSMLVAGIVGAMLISSPCYAENYDFQNMSAEELKAVEQQIEDELKANHELTSDEEDAVLDAVKAYVENEYGEDNVDWAWIDYTYTKDWNYYTVTTHADITKHDGGKAQYDVVGDVFATDNNYQVVYVKIGEEELLNDRATAITDPRVLKILGLGDETTPETEGESAASDTATAETQAAATEDTVIAKRGDKSDDVAAIQQMLIRIGYLSGNADGAFGGGTEDAVKKFQSENGLDADGIVKQSDYDKLKSLSDAAPEPVETISVSAADLYNAFSDNEISANDKYKGKVVQVTGTVGSVDETWGSPWVNLDADEWGITSVMCMFPKDAKSQLASLSSGQSITIQGTCDGMSLGSVSVMDCSIVG